MKGAVIGREIGTENGAAAIFTESDTRPGSAADRRDASDFVNGGAPPRHIDQATAELDRYARTWIDLAQTRKALAQREIDDRIVAEFDRLEKKVAGALMKALRRHTLWPWLSQYPGLGGAHTALIIGRIGDPRRYPGQRCSEGHYLPPLYAIGAPCPVAETHVESETCGGDGASEARADDRHGASDRRLVCPGVMLTPRDTTGVRSLWHWAGLHADDEGRAPRKRKGVRCTWEPRARASVMQPGGLAEQIVRLNVPYYADLYRTAKARLNLRVIAPAREIEILDGDANPLRAAEAPRESEHRGGRPLRPFEADRTARKIAAKAFLADLLTEWKRIA